MITYIIKRIVSGESTFGVFIDDKNVPFAVTLELPDKNNQHNVSCIPPNASNNDEKSITYTCKRVMTPKHGECFQIMNVKDRDMILLHVANTNKDILGCIGVGEKFDPVSVVNGIAESKLGYDEFMKKLSGVNEFNLRIIDCTEV